MIYSELHNLSGIHVCYENAKPLTLLVSATVLEQGRVTDIVLCFTT